MSTALPKFKYHPHPLQTSSIDESKTTCICCGKQTGYVYTGPTYAKNEYDNVICPWCIHDGSAHKKLGASFTDEEGIGGGGPIVKMLQIIWAAWGRVN